MAAPARRYLDHAASSPPLPAVVAALPRILAETAGNPSSAHAEGVAARRAVEGVRERLASRHRLDRRGVVFTSGATEANNLVLRAFAARGKTVVVSPLEHPSVASACAALFPAERRLAMPFAGTAADLPALERLLRERDVGLVCAMSVNNETGLRLPVAEIGALIGRVSPRTRLHVDAVQSFLRDPHDLHAHRIDYLVFSGHKLGALKGTGGLLIRDGARDDLAPALFGGGQEEGLRPGTENAPGIAALGVACDFWFETGASLGPRFAALAARLREELAGAPGVVPLPPADYCDRIVGILLEDLPAADPVVRMLSEAGYAVSSGAACSTGRARENKSVAALAGPGGGRPRSLLRVSFGAGSTEADLDGFASALGEALRRAKGSS